MELQEIIKELRDAIIYAKKNHIEDQIILLEGELENALSLVKK